MTVNLDETNEGYCRPWIVCAISAVFLSMIAVLANLSPCEYGGRLLLRASEFRHGLPLVYMERSYKPPWAQVSIYHGPWPFLDATPEIEGFSWPALLVNLAIGGVVVFATTASFAAWLSRKSAVLRVITLTLMLIACVSWLVIGIWGFQLAQSPWHTDGLSVPWLIFLLLVPGLGYLALMLFAVVAVLCWIIRPAQVTTWQAVKLAAALLFVAGFYVNVARDWFALTRSIDDASFFTMVIAAIVLLALAWRLCYPRDKHSGNYAFEDPTFAGFPLLSWLAMAIMFATTSHFVYTNYIPYNNGALYFDAYGWPWTYSVSADGDANFYKDIHLMNGWTIGERRYLPLAADTVVLMCMSVATLAASTALTRIEGIRPSFSLARVFAVVLILSLPLTLEGGEARPVNWPNWYVHFIVSLGLAAVGYLALRLIRWTLQTLTPLDASTELGIADGVEP